MKNKIKIKLSHPQVQLIAAIMTHHLKHLHSAGNNSTGKNNIYYAILSDPWMNIYERLNMKAYSMNNGNSYNMTLSITQAAALYIILVDLEIDHPYADSTIRMVIEKIDSNYGFNKDLTI